MKSTISLTRANELALQVMPSDEELQILLHQHMRIESLAAIAPGNASEYREGAARAAVVASCVKSDIGFDFNVRDWILGSNRFTGRLSFANRLTGLVKEIGYPEKPSKPSE